MTSQGRVSTSATSASLLYGSQPQREYSSLGEGYEWIGLACELDRCTLCQMVVEQTMSRQKTKIGAINFYKIPNAQL